MVDVLIPANVFSLFLILEMLATTTHAFFFALIVELR